MSWQISHTPEAWDNVRHNLMHHWEAQELVDALADAAYETAPDGDGSQALHDMQLKLGIYLRNDDMATLADLCLEEIAKHNLCSNGGHEFFIDPEGWHKVSCSRNCKCEGEE